MKSAFRYAPVIFITTTLLRLNTVYDGSFRMNSTNNVVLGYQNKQPVINEANFQQTKAQVEFFKQALDQLGATTPEQVVTLWVKAEETRNGVFHYAVACNELKKKIIEEWGNPQKSFWIIGTSSPWLDRYEIVSKKKLNDLSYEIKIKYFWTTSAGQSEPTENTLVIIKYKDIWCVKEVK
ncbi:hypothetical protein CPJCM30710_17850 [Clostridium polyendosporum]|uniref:Uncharacterized protein n=1 Tax=Clostridium polyendosporum TaxID=69208 RepID=A0A919S0E2_9CLOT|nr:hypothetical protein [Clostridium polyendosporum]GIM29119.1 hypothetical protein CPJCM30710_17850 [Clostridium polyendosporum]